MKVIVLVNLRAGTAPRAADDAERLREWFLAAGVAAEVRAVPGSQLTLAATEALADRPDAIVAAGGDGTVAGVAAALAGRDMPMGIVPLGTLNHFARDLGIPTDPQRAAAVIAAGRVQAVDVATVNERIFINNSSIGIYPEVVRHRDAQIERLGRSKWLAMFMSLLRALRRFALYRVTLHVHGQELHRRTPFVFVGNNEYEMNLLAIGGRKSIGRGQLSLYIANTPGRFGMLRLAVLTVLGRLRQARDFETFAPEDVVIATRKRLVRVAMDGETTMLAPPLRYEIRPGALRVLMPEQS